MQKPEIDRSTWIRLAMFAGTLLLLLIFMPRPDRLRLNYDLNRPWENSQLLAPFDFPVYRDSLEKKAMVDSINAHFIPVFTLDQTPLTRITAAVNSAADLSATERRAVLTVLERIYRSGVVESDIAGRIVSGSLSDIYISRPDGTTSLVSAKSMKSSRRAYEFFDSVFSSATPTLMQHLRHLGLGAMMLPNYIQDRDASSRRLTELLQPIEAGLGVIQKGEKIIDRGEIVTPEVMRILHSYERAMEEQRDRTSSTSDFNIGLGQFLYVAGLLTLLYIFLLIYRPAVFQSWRKVLCILSLMAAFVIFAVILSDTFASGLYVVPFAIMPILLVVFFDTAVALFVFLLEALLCATLASFPLEFIFLQTSAGVTAAFSMRELSRRSQLLRTAMFIFLAYVVSYAAVELMQVASLSSFSWRLVGAFAINMVLISFAYILIFICEKIFGFTSVVTLVELADINNPVLRELSEECPGTFQHSMAVSNLAADAARRIGANVQLVRAGALYHDIGKTRNPAFFTENQHGVNPHSTLDPRQSAGIIIRHVTDGIKIAEKYKLPQVIKDMILQHHGKSTARYFLTTCQNQHPGEEIDPAPFTYPGPNPRSAEASLLMMADVVEAASRSLPDHSPEAISALVNRLIDGQVEAGLHKDSPLSFRDVSIIKQAFIDRLRTMYHVRIAYPDRKKS